MNNWVRRNCLGCCYRPPIEGIVMYVDHGLENLLRNSIEYINPNLVDPKTGHALVYIATTSGQPEILQILVDADADVNWIDPVTGNTSAYIASRNGKIDCLQILVNAGADVNIPNNEGETPVYIATKKQDLEVLQILVNAGADVNKKTNRGETPLIRALRFWGTEILQILVRARGVDVNLQSSAWINNYSVNNTPVWWAARTGNVVGLQILINAGAILTLRGGDSDLTPLEVAISEGNDACANIITEVIAQEEDQAIINRHDSSTEGSVSSIPEEE